MLPQNAILNIFSWSLVQLLQCYKEEIHNFVKSPSYFFNMLIVRDWKRTLSLQQNIIQFETKNDKLKHDFRCHFSKFLFSPTPLNDLLAIFLEKQIKITNTIKNISVIIIERRMEILSSLLTTKLKNPLIYYAKISFQAPEVINFISNFLILCFQRKQKNYVNKLIQQLDDIKYQTNQLQIQIRQPLPFQIKNTLLPINVIFLYKIIKNQLLKRLAIISNY